MAAVDTLIAGIVRFLPNSKEVVEAGPLNQDEAYWVKETDVWPHRRGVWLWISGSIPEGRKAR